MMDNSDYNERPTLD